MNIIKTSIKNFTNDFIYFMESLDGLNYVTLFQGCIFEYQGNEPFNINNLKTIFSSDNPDVKKVSGTLKNSTYKSIKNDITHALSFISDEHYHDFIKTSDRIIQRENTYWNIVKNHFSYTPHKVIKHIPDEKSYFGDYVMWEFTYILLYKGHGIVLSGQAWD